MSLRLHFIVSGVLGCMSLSEKEVAQDKILRPVWRQESSASDELIHIY